jgi:hypothetical protein
VTGEQIAQRLDDADPLVAPVEQQLASVQADLDHMDLEVPAREGIMTDDEKITFQADRETLRATFAELTEEMKQSTEALTVLKDGLSKDTMEAAVDGEIVWLRSLLRIVQGSVVVQARARLEAISVEPFELESEEAFEIALANRLDFMNGRAALVDNWRQIQVRADALQSNLTVKVDGDIRTGRDNPTSFRAPTGSAKLGVEFDAPFTRLEERNAYRDALIDYQRKRRSFIQSRDKLHLGLRGLLRQIAQLLQNLEIQRRAVGIAIRRVDMTREELYKPVPAMQPGVRAMPLGPTAARDFLNALTSLRNTQNAFMGVWLSYYAARMSLARELGIMTLDEQGRWIDYALPGSDMQDILEDEPSEPMPLPPPFPEAPIESATAIEAPLPIKLVAEMKPAAEIEPTASFEPNSMPEPTVEVEHDELPETALGSDLTKWSDDDFKLPVRVVTRPPDAVSGVR